MSKRMILPLLFGLVGTAILLSLGTWQVQRLAWKEGVLVEIEARIGGDPVVLPVGTDPEADRYMPVEAEGVLTGEGLRVLASVKQIGAVHRIVGVLETGERRVLADLGYVRVLDGEGEVPTGPVTLTGNLHWPDEVDGWTPEPDAETGLWFARDVPAMAAALGTEPVLVVARTTSLDGITPLPVGTEGIPNDHLQYAITWFSLALVWVGMTVFLLWRIRRRTV